MKIKVDHYIAKKIAEVAEATIMQCIDENMMSKEFELSDIKGKVWVGHAPHTALDGGSAYQYSVTLFNRIQLVTGGIFIKHLSFTQDIQRTIMSGLGTMMTQSQNPQLNVDALVCAINQAFTEQNKEVTFNLYNELAIKFEYAVDSQESHVFYVGIIKEEKLLANYHNYGDSKNSVHPQATGIMALLGNLVGSYRPSKPQKFYITEHTVFHNPSLLCQQPTAMINQNPMQPAYAYAGNTPNFNSFNGGMNTNDPFSSY